MSEYCGRKSVRPLPHAWLDPIGKCLMRAAERSADMWHTWVQFAEIIGLLYTFDTRGPAASL